MQLLAGPTLQKPKRVSVVPYVEPYDELFETQLDIFDSIQKIWPADSETRDYVRGVLVLISARLMGLDTTHDEKSGALELRANHQRIINERLLEQRYKDKTKNIPIDWSGVRKTPYSWYHSQLEGLKRQTGNSPFIKELTGHLDHELLNFTRLLFRD